MQGQKRDDEPVRMAEKAAILQNLEAGNGIVASVKAAGVGTSTYYKWMNPEDKTYDEEFANAVVQAQTRGLGVIKELCLASILAAGTQGTRPVWQAAAWILERKWPEEFALKTKTEFSGSVNTEPDLSTYTPEEKKLLLKIAREHDYSKKQN